MGRSRALRDINNDILIQNQYDISNCRVTVTGCGEAAEVRVVSHGATPQEKGGISSHATQSGFRSVAVVEDCLFPFISSALDGRLAPVIAKWRLINLDNCGGPRDRDIPGSPVSGFELGAWIGLGIGVHFRPRRPICRKFRPCKKPKASACDDRRRTSVNCGTYLGHVRAIRAH